MSGLIGFLVGLIIFVIGILIGFAAGKNSGANWIKEHGCFTCQERYKNRLFE